MSLIVERKVSTLKENQKFEVELLNDSKTGEITVALFNKLDAVDIFKKKGKIDYDAHNLGYVKKNEDKLNEWLAVSACRNDIFDKSRHITFTAKTRTEAILTLISQLEKQITREQKRLDLTLHYSQSSLVSIFDEKIEALIEEEIADCDQRVEHFKARVADFSIENNVIDAFKWDAEMVVTACFEKKFLKMLKRNLDVCLRKISDDSYLEESKIAVSANAKGYISLVEKLVKDHREAHSKSLIENPARLTQSKFMTNVEAICEAQAKSNLLTKTFARIERLCRRNLDVS